MATATATATASAAVGDGEGGGGSVGVGTVGGSSGFHRPYSAGVGWDCDGSGGEGGEGGEGGGGGGGGGVGASGHVKKRAKSTFSQATIESEKGDGIDMDDPNFWAKMLPGDGDAAKARR